MEVVLQIIFGRMRYKLIHFITNYVTINDVANITLAYGERPIMAEAIEEVEQITKNSKCLVINFGTITKQRYEIIMKAIGTANKNNIPVILDPVGIGASKFRKKLITHLLNIYKVNVIKGNLAEIKTLLDMDTLNRGVDSKEVYDESVIDIAKKVSIKYKTTVLVTGEVDIVASNRNIIKIHDGSKFLTHITGAGCMLSALIAVSLIRIEDDYEACINAVQDMNKCSKIAEERLISNQGTGMFKVNLIDAISNLRGRDEKMDRGKKLYLITDYTVEFDKLLENVEYALSSGVSILQYRNKDCSTKKMLYQAEKLKVLCNKYKVTFIINDRIDIALAVDADGVHLGRDDIPVKRARKLLGKDKIIGATAKTVEQAQKAQLDGADYLGVGALNSSPTKMDAIKISQTLLGEIKSSVSIPIYGIGGIKLKDLTEGILKFVDGVAVVSAILYAEDIKSTTQEFVKKLN